MEFLENLGRLGKQPWENTNRKNCEYKMGKLEEITTGIEFVGIVILYGLISTGNELFEQSKHAYYHASGIKHRRVTVDEDPETNFPYYAREN